jgi:hypothetical protein
VKNTLFTNHRSLANRRLSLIGGRSEAGFDFSTLKFARIDIT